MAVMESGSSVNFVAYNLGMHPLVSFNFLLRVEAVYDLPCKSVRAFTKELEYEYIQEGGLNDYVHLRRKPITKPFTLEIERYAGTYYIDPLPLGADLLLPVILLVSRYSRFADQFLSTARTYAFTGCTVIKKTYGELNAERSGLLTDVITLAYREMICLDTAFSDSMLGEGVNVKPGEKFYAAEWEKSIREAEERRLKEELARKAKYEDLQKQLDKLKKSEKALVDLYQKEMALLTAARTKTAEELESIREELRAVAEAYEEERAAFLARRKELEEELGLPPVPEEGEVSDEERQAKIKEYEDRLAQIAQEREDKAQELKELMEAERKLVEDFIAERERLREELEESEAAQREQMEKERQLVEDLRKGQEELEEKRREKEAEIAALREEEEETVKRLQAENEAAGAGGGDEAGGAGDGDEAAGAGDGDEAGGAGDGDEAGGAGGGDEAGGAGDGDEAGGAGDGDEAGGAGDGDEAGGAGGGNEAGGAGGGNEAGGAGGGNEAGGAGGGNEAGGAGGGDEAGGAGGGDEAGGAGGGN